MKFIFCILTTLILSYGYAETQHSDLKSDEQLIFFQTDAWLNQQTQQWHLPIHGWVFELEDSVVRKQAIASVLKQKYKLQTNAATEANFSRRINHLIADNERGKEIWIQIANQKHRLTESHANGHIQTLLTIDVASIQAASHHQQIEFQALLDDDDNRSFTGRINLIPSHGLSIISDIDDTIKISEVGNRKKLLEHTFFLDFKAVPGMANMYQKWSEPNSALHFVSSSPWQLYPDLLKLTQQAQFPEAAFHLKNIRFKDSSFFNLFKKGIETKPTQIRSILNTFPKRHFILVGDSGEQDPEVYVQIHAEFPDKIRCILIRNVTAESADNTRFKKLFSDIPDTRWMLFEHAEEITLNNTSHCLD
ncbi:phosphatidate phosphatase App1 family protein [Marinicella sp. W31]|uniref:phosphatidate phosphatase App1 family protein n=1 Tax=Marinicella sp. W31 TaxID=3023713 RepID=UPI003757EF3A